MNKSNTFVINLDKDKKRLNNIEKLLNNNFTRFSAIYGKNLSKNEINNNATNICKYFLCNYSIVGCAMSHLNLWQKLIDDETNNFYIIFEDDLKFIDTELVNKLVDNLNNLDYDYINLYCEFCGSYDCELEIENNFKICKTIFPLTTAGYIINKKGAKKLVSKLKNNISYHIDFTIALFQYLHSNFKILRTTPNLVEPSTLDSNINTSIVSPLFFLMRKCKYTKLSWLLLVPVFTINMRYNIPIYLLLLVILLIVFRKNKYIYLILTAEIIFCVYSLIR